MDWIIEFDNFDQGIGSGADQLVPFAGVAFGNGANGLTFISLVQHFVSFSGPTDVSKTSMRLIAIKPFSKDYWAKLDLKVPYDWNAHAWPSTTELQLGYNFTKRSALYGELLAVLGSDRPYDKGFGVGLRFRY